MRNIIWAKRTVWAAAAMHLIGDYIAVHGAAYADSKKDVLDYFIYGYAPMQVLAIGTLIGVGCYLFCKRKQIKNSDVIQTEPTIENKLNEESEAIK